MSAPNSQIRHDLLTLCLRLCLEPTDSHSPETMAVLERYRPAWEAAAGGMPFDQALALVPSEKVAPENDGTAHIDHPLRHFDRTCRACWREDALEEAAKVCDWRASKEGKDDEAENEAPVCAGHIRALKNADPQELRSSTANPVSDSPTPAESAFPCVVAATWIACSERLPEGNEPVIAYCPRAGATFREVISAKWLRDNVDMGHITHWMPLPEAPTPNIHVGSKK